MLLTTFGVAQSAQTSSKIPESPPSAAKSQSNYEADAGQQLDRNVLSAAAQAQISSTIGEDQTTYHAVRQPRGFRVTNPGHDVSVEFTAEGVAFSHGTNRWGMDLRSYGYGDRVREASAAAPDAKANRVEYRRDGLTEWYVNGPLGLEQGFTLEHPPGTSNGQPLTLAIALSGNLTASVNEGGRDLTLSRDGAAVLRYTGLTAVDANGREHRAWLEVDASQLRVRVDDAGARYPLTIDPYVQAKKLTSAIQCSFGGVCDDGGSFNYFGQSVSISTDGTTIVVGAPYKQTNGAYTGAAYVFMKPPVQVGGWDSPVPLYYATKLANSDGPATQLKFGWTTSISSDGQVIVVGAPGWIGGPSGAAYVFVRPGNGWGSSSVQTETAKLQAQYRTEVNLNGSFADALAISGDANTIAVGAPGYHKTNDDPRGAVYMFYRPGAGWTTATETTRVIGNVYTKHGSSVSLNANGTVMVVGAPQSQFNYQGAAFIRVRLPLDPGFPDTWSGGARLEVSDGIAGDYFGYSVSANADGSVLVVGAPATLSSGNTQPGAAYVFVRPASGWPTQSSLNLKEVAKLTASDGQPNDWLGTSVSSSSDGNTIAAGASQAFQFSGPGAVYVFKKAPGRAWTTRTEAAKVVASDRLNGDRFGYSAAMSGDGSVLIAGAAYKNVGGQPVKGAAYVFTGSASAPTASTSTTIDSASPNPVMVGQPMAVAFTVAPPQGDLLTPSGAVTVQASTGESCTGIAPSGSCNLTFATAIDRTIAATYSGDSNFSASTSPNALVRVVDFTLAVSPASQTINGKKATYYISVSPVNGFTGTVSLVCSGGPPNTSCVMSPASVSLSGATVTTKGTVTLPNGAPSGTYTITFTGSSGVATRSTTANLTKSTAARLPQ